MNNTDVLIEITNPEKSIFVSANAGSGKTFILVSRVLSLLLAGEEASKILCISFTEAAANEMKERVKSQALKWHHMEDFSQDPLLKMAEKSVIFRAKNLYRDTILQDKMPKIITFHSFCFEIINSFSAESNLAYKVSILSSSAEKIIKKDIIKKLFLKSKTRKILNEIKYLFTNSAIEENIIPAILNIKNERVFLQNNFHLQPYKNLNISYNSNEIREIVKHLTEKLLSEISMTEIETFHFHMKQGGVSEIKTANKVATFLKTLSLQSLKSAFLKKEETPFARPITQGTLNKNPVLAEIYENIATQLVNFLNEINKIACAKVTENLILLISEVASNYEKAKEKFEMLDFNDLIFKTREALYSENRDFILFKLDGGIKHILVDEAQDTNFIQWEILFSILEEFFSGNTVERGARSLFVVGDEKQSIFGFQGSQPEVLTSILEKYKKDLTILTLQKSYRTTPLILKLVDKIFSQIPSFKGYSNHLSVKENGFGRVQLLKPVIIEKTSNTRENEIWRMPWENKEKEDLKKGVAQQISAKIFELLNEKRVLMATGKPVKPCDFMLLSKSRDPKMFSYLKLELKAHNIGISFGDKIKLSESLPLQDFILTLKSLINPANSYALACVLRSPMFALTDTQLENIFYHKTAELPTDFTEIKTFLNLSLDGFFRKLIVKFQEKYDANDLKEIAQIFTLIEEFKANGGSNNFEGFIQFCETLTSAGESFKISFTEKENNIKINTVHGSKGLESPIVFILNANEVFSKKSSSEYLMFNENFESFLLAKANMKIAEWETIKLNKQKKDYEEYLRLLYVAMTRSCEELYIFAKNDAEEKPDFPSWYEIIKNAMEGSEMQEGKIEFSELTDPEITKGERILVPQEINLTPETAKKFSKATKSSNLQGKSVESGSIIHSLLEMTEISEKSVQFFYNKFPAFSQEEIEQFITIAKNIKNKFPQLFDSSTLSEVEVMLEMKDDEFFIGKIDKLLIYETEVHIIDFKFYATEIINDEITKQLKSYAKAMQKIYPKMKVKTFILWSKNLQLQEV